jgi:hypothetical protein
MTSQTRGSVKTAAVLPSSQPLSFSLPPHQSSLSGAADTNQPTDVEVKEPMVFKYIAASSVAEEAASHQTAPQMDESDHNGRKPELKVDIKRATQPNSTRFVD